jgi:hypothetical protein
MEEITTNKINRILQREFKYNFENQAQALKICLAEIEAKIKAEKDRDDLWLKEKLERQTRLEERRRIHGYKPVSFKKPLPPLEERRQYVRICKKCEGEYRTFAKYGKICDGCSKSGRTFGVPFDLRPRKEHI